MRRRSLRLLLAAALVAAAPIRAEIFVTGVVTNEGGEPLPGAAVDLLPVRGAYSAGLDALEGHVDPAPAASVVTGDDGLFDLRVPEAGLWTVRAAATGFVPMHTIMDPLVRGIALPAVALRSGRSVTVAARGPDGQPLAGVLVSARSRSNELWRQDPMAGRKYWFRGGSREVTADDGRVLLQRAEGETLEVRAFAPGLVPARAVVGPSDRVDLTLGTGRTAVIEVRDGGGRPVPGALISFGGDRCPAGLTDERGRLQTAVATSGTVRAVAADGRRGERRLEEGRETIPVPLEPAAVVRGIVLDLESRAPIAGALVWSGGDPDQLVRTDSGGRFSLPAWWRRGGNSAFAAAPGYFADARRLPENGDSEPVLALQPAASASGEIVDTHGEPVVGAEIKATPIAGGSGSIRMPRLGGAVRSRAGGTFHLETLVPGIPMQLRATAHGFAPTTSRLDPVEARQSVGGLRLVLRRGGGLRGRLVGGGEPAPGATVELFREPDSSRPLDFLTRQMEDPNLTTAADGQGVFEIRNLAAGSYRLRATMAGFAPLRLRGVEITEDADTDLGTLELEPGAEISGIVVDDSGRPVEGAKVRATGHDPWTSSMMARMGDGPPDAISDADGRFVVPDRRPGERVDLTVTREELRNGHASSVEAPNETPLRIVLERGARISGTVVDEGGSPIADARIDVTLEEAGPRNSPSVRQRFGERPGGSDGDGRFEIDRAPSGRIRLTASARGWLPSEIGGLEVAPGGRLDGIQLVLRRGATVTGRVSEGDGRPAVGVMLSVQTQSLARVKGMRPFASTDGDGHYTLEGVEPGMRTIVAQTTYTERIARELEVKPGVNRLDLQFVAGVTISGQVLDGSGAPVGGARLVLIEESRMRGSPDGRSKEDGSFEIDGVRDGLYRLQASRSGYAQTTSAELVQVAGSPITGLEVRLVAGAAIAGELIGLEPDQRAVVEVAAVGDARTYAVGRVERDGGYRIPDLAAGEWKVLAMVPDGPRAHGTVTLGPGTDEARLDLDFTSGLTLSGQVLRNGEAAAGLQVGLQGGDLRDWVNSTTDSQGRFRLESVDPGSYRLQVSDREGMRYREEVDLQSDLELLVEITAGRVSGRVLDAQDLRPLTDAGVSLIESVAGVESPSLDLFDRGTDREGRFVIPAVAAGDYHLQVVQEGYAPVRTPISVPPGGDLAGLEIRLEPSSGLRLTVLGPTGAPAAEVKFAVLDASGRALTAGYRTADPGGRIHLTSVPGGSFELLLSSPGSAVRRMPVTVPGPELTVRLEPTCILDVSVRALAGEAVLSTMRITAADGRSFVEPGWTTVRREWHLDFGERTVAGLPAGGYTVEVTTSDGRSWQGRVTVAPGSNRLEL